MKPLFILVVGGPTGGFVFYGPFETEDDAIHEAEEMRVQESWWIAPVHAPTRD